MIAGRERLDASKARGFEPASQNDMSVQPAPARRNLRERHANLKRDTGLLREDSDRAERLNERDHTVEQRADLRRLVSEMSGKVMSAACVRLIPVGELTTALGAAPQWIRHALVPAMRIGAPNAAYTELSKNLTKPASPP